MKKLPLTLGAMAALMMLGLHADSAQANQATSSFGLHIGGRNLQLSVGSTNARAYPYGEQVAYRRPYSNPYWYDSHGRRTARYYSPPVRNDYYRPAPYPPRRDRCDAGRDYGYRDAPGYYARNSRGNWDRREVYQPGRRW